MPEQDNTKEHKQSRHEIRTALMMSLTPEQVGTNKTDRTFRYALLMLLNDIADSQDSLSACYRRMLNIQEQKNGGPR